MGSQKSLPKFQNAAKARQWEACQIPCKEVLRSHPVKLQRYNTLGSIKASCKNAAQLSQERLHVPPMAKLERQDYQRWSPDKPTRAPGAGCGVAAFVGCLFVCLFVLMSLVLLCTSQNGDLQVQWETLNEKKKRWKRNERDTCCCPWTWSYMCTCADKDCPPPPSFSLPLPGILLPPFKLKNS